jgi:hypothetical protein
VSNVVASQVKAALAMLGAPKKRPRASSSDAADSGGLHADGEGSEGCSSEVGSSLCGSSLALEGSAEGMESEACSSVDSMEHLGLCPEGPADGPEGPADGIAQATASIEVGANMAPSGADMVPPIAADAEVRRPKAFSSPAVLKHLMPGQGKLPASQVYLRQDFLQNRFTCGYHGTTFSKSYGPRSPGIEAVLEDVLCSMWAMHTAQTGQHRPAELLLSNVEAEFMAPVFGAKIQHNRGL